LYLALKGEHFPRVELAAVAIQKAPPDSVVLVLAENYPTRGTVIEPASFELAQKKNVRLFVEYPAALPGFDLGMPRAAIWERIVVASEKFAPSLPKLRILAAHDCRYLPVSGAFNPDLVLAKVAGYDKAIYGIPETNVFPILFEVPERNLMIATTRLSGFVVGRYAPSADWQLLWQQILSALGARQGFPLTFKPVVAPAWSSTAELPRNFQKQTFAEAAHWFGHSHLLVSRQDRSS